MRKNKTMKRGGGGFLNFDTMKTLGSAGLDQAVKTGINHAASNGRISFSNPKGVKMPPNLFGFAKSSLGKYTNNSPGMSWVDRAKSVGEGVSKFSNSKEGKSLLNNKFVNHLGNAALNSADRRMTKHITNFSVGTGK